MSALVPIPPPSLPSEEIDWVIWPVASSAHSPSPSPSLGEAVGGGGSVITHGDTNIFNIGGISTEGGIVF